MNRHCPSCGENLKWRRLVPSKGSYTVKGEVGKCPECGISLIVRRQPGYAFYVLSMVLVMAPVWVSSAFGYKLSIFDHFVILIPSFIAFASSFYLNSKLPKDWPEFVAFSEYSRSTQKKESSEDRKQIAKNIADYKQRQREIRESAQWWEIWK